MLQEATTTDFINLTPNAMSAVQDLIDKRELEGYALRIYIAGGGCSGYQYGMALDNNFRDTDQIAEFGNVKVVVDEISIDYLKGATVDYVDEVMGSGFKIENPNAISSCGCGSSFKTEGSEGPQAGGGCASGCG